jgi:hypothetical protein
MRSRPGPLPTGVGWSFEPKYDGFWAVISTEKAIPRSSRRGWEMGSLVRSRIRAERLSFSVVASVGCYAESCHVRHTLLPDAYSRVTDSAAHQAGNALR